MENDEGNVLVKYHHDINKFFNDGTPIMEGIEIQEDERNVAYYCKIWIGEVNEVLTRMDNVKLFENLRKCQMSGGRTLWSLYLRTKEIFRITLIAGIKRKDEGSRESIWFYCLGKAYNLASREVLWKTLRKKGVCGAYIWAMQDIMKA
ncbi:hypothetical protein CR513_34360, partial [Mucuna pruriens]